MTLVVGRTCDFGFIISHSQSRGFSCEKRADKTLWHENIISDVKYM